MELELKASIISEIPDLQRALLFSPIEIGKNVPAQKSPLSLTLICFLAFSFSQTDLAPKGTNCKASSYGPRISGVDPPTTFKGVDMGTVCKVFYANVGP